jgi:hypothetical protein
MKVEEKEALLVLKAAGWRPLQASGSCPVGGLLKTVRRENASKSVLNAIAVLLACGWEQAHESEDYPWIPTLIAPPNRAHEELFR